MPRRETLASLGEFGFLDRLIRRSMPGTEDLILGPGDDCAVVRSRAGSLLLTIDALVEGVHFESAWMTPRQIGAKALAVNLSDIAAMGGKPRWVLIAINAPATCTIRDLSAIQRSIELRARAVGAEVIGGNLTRAPQLAVTIALVGQVEGVPLQRSGARPGDAIFVTGTIGDSGLGLRMLQGKVAPARGAVRRFLEPQPRLEIGCALARQRIASAAIDVSDGLLQDLGHLCRASHVGARIDSAALPVSTAYRRLHHTDHAAALTSGEDYELLFTVGPRKLPQLERLIRDSTCSITRIGEITSRATVTVDGRPARSLALGFDHFRDSKKGRGA